MDQGVVDALRSRGADVLTPLELVTAAKTDEEQLRLATESGRCIYSFNMRDFCRIHGEFVSRSERHAGIIVARQQTLSIGEQMRRLLRLMAALSADEMRNRLEFLAAWGDAR